MNISKILIIFLIIINFQGKAQVNRVMTNSENLKEVNYLKSDDFYLTHYLYIDLFLRENLLLDATKEEVVSVLSLIKKHSNAENPLEIVINKTNDIKYKITVVLIKNEKEEILALYTNWNPVLKKFEEKITDDSYTRWYFLNDKKFTYRKDMSKEKDYQSMKKSSLANVYLFDELDENDSEIENLFKSKNSSDDIEEDLYFELVMLKYFIFKRNQSKADEIIKSLNIKFEQNKEERKIKGLEHAFKTTLFQIELMKNL
jgi:hypothetical protein